MKNRALRAVMIAVVVSAMGACASVDSLGAAKPTEAAAIAAGHRTPDGLPATPVFANNQ